VAWTGLVESLSGGSKFTSAGMSEDPSKVSFPSPASAGAAAAMPTTHARPAMSTAAAVAIAGLSPDDYPALKSAAAEFSAAMAGEGRVEYGLERILDALEARLAALKSAAD
jgi:hypothetical protein